jgi:hypothetical protein
MDVGLRTQSLLPILRAFRSEVSSIAAAHMFAKTIRYNMMPNTNAKTRTHCNQNTNTSYNSSTTNLLIQPERKEKLRESTVVANLQNPFLPHMNSLNKAKNGDDGTETSRKDLHTCNHLTALNQNLTSALSLYLPPLNVYEAHQKHTKKATNKTDFRSLQTTSILHQMASNLVSSARLLLWRAFF